jgi:hypothetical protein
VQKGVKQPSLFANRDSSKLENTCELLFVNTQKKRYYELKRMTQRSLNGEKRERERERDGTSSTSTSKGNESDKCWKVISQVEKF